MSASVFAVPAMAQDITIKDLINLLIAIGVIPQDKMQMALNLANGIDATAPAQVSTATTASNSVSIAINNAVQYGTNKSDAFITTSIASSPDNKKVTSWSLRVDCPAGVSLIVPSKTNSVGINLCGITTNYNSSSYYDISQGVSLLTAGAKNTNKDSSYVGFALIAYDANGNNIGGDKDVVQLEGLYSSTSTQDGLVNTVSIVGSPTLQLSYDSAQKESQLTANFNLNISATAGGKDLDVYQRANPIMFTNQTDNSKNNYGTVTISPITKLDNATDQFGQLYYIIPAGTTASFNATSQVNPKIMFAGSYITSFNSVIALYGDAYNAFSISAPSNQTNSKTIIGELSPYITSVTNPISVGQKMSVGGVRLLNAMGRGNLYIDGSAQMNVAVDGSKDGTLLFFVLPSLTSGQHSLVVNDINTGMSNMAFFQVSGSTSVTQPTITPAQSTVSSGQNIRLILSSPYASHSSVYFNCPSGVSMGELCNTYINTTSNGDWSPLFINSTSQNQNVAVNYTVYNSSGDTNPSIASAVITVLPSSVAVQSSVPSNLTATTATQGGSSCSNNVQLSWTGSVNAATYNIYRWTGTRHTGATVVVNVANVPANVAGVPVTYPSFTDTTGTPGVKYEYAMYATNSAGVKTAWNITSTQDGAIVTIPTCSSTAITNQPYVTIGVVMNNTKMENNTNINIGDTFQIQGAPYNVSGLQVTRAFFFDPIFNDSCSNNDSAAVYTLTCTAQKSGSSKFYIEMYANGVTYKSNIFTVNVVSPATVSPSISITSPNGSGAFTAGTFIPVSFTTANLAGQVIQITLNNTDTSHAYPLTQFTNGADGVGQINEAIPSNIPAGNHYNITFSTSVAGATSNGNFTIVGPTTIQPSITVTSPNGGETFSAGVNMPVSFTTNLSVGTHYEVSLVGRAPDGTIYDGTLVNGNVSSSNTQTISATIPQNISAGNYYRVRVDAGCSATSCPQDQSDSNFSITLVSIVPPCLNGAGALLPGQSYCTTSVTTPVVIQQPSVTTISCKFDATKYANYYADLKNAFGYDQTKLKSHWLTYGLNEGRTPCGADMPSCKFNSATYLSYNPDVVKAGMDAKVHYTTYGVNEGRDVCRTTTAVTDSNTASVSIASDQLLRLIQALMK
jgi:hypothetical protein